MPLTAREKERVCDQILRVVDQLFVHRRMKAALYGFNANSMLRRLRNEAPRMSDADFHRSMRNIVAQIRDRHTRYAAAGAGPDHVLPFRIERAFEAGSPVYVVTRSTDPGVPVGSEVSRWNGLPIEFVIKELAEDVAAGNDHSRRALATHFLTYRPAARFDAPQENEVRVELHLADGSQREARLAWSPAPAVAFAAHAARPYEGMGLDPDLLILNQRTFEVFSPRFRELTAVAYPNVETRTVTQGGVDYGYLRIRHFQVNDADDFARHVAAKLKTLPKNGLIIDLRGNPGGYIKAGELLLQFLTDRKIQPHGFRFRASDAVDHIIGHSDTFHAWGRTVSQGRRLGAEHSATFPIETREEDFNTIGRVYPGPSVLVVDALTFSTGDMVTAGYKDHAIGPVICTDENISAGGANNWPYDVLRACFPGFLVPASAEAELANGRVAPELAAAFAENGHPLPADAAVGQIPEDRLGPLWEVSTGNRAYRIAKRDWLRRDLAVHFPGDNPFVEDLPAGVEFGFSIRQAVRRGLSDGLVLEDEGIEADHYYKMTRQDLLKGNSDLIAFACSLLRS